MAVETIDMSLVCWRKAGEVTYDEFVGSLQLKDDDVYEKLGAEPGLRRTAVIRYFSLDIKSFPKSPERREEFEATLATSLDKAADWLDARPIEAFQHFSRSGLALFVLINLWIDSNQMDLDLPAKFLRACSRLALRIQVMSNE